jgi:hypothetical protein
VQEEEPRCLPLAARFSPKPGTLLQHSLHHVLAQNSPAVSTTPDAVSGLAEVRLMTAPAQLYMLLGRQQSYAHQHYVWGIVSTGPTQCTPHHSALVYVWLGLCIEHVRKMSQVHAFVPQGVDPTAPAL